MLQTGEIVDRYTVQRVLGQGGMAVVYMVEHHQLKSQHALKVLTVGSKAITERMMQEGRVQASLRHPNIVAVHDVIDIAGAPGLLMEYVDGPSLDEFLMKTPLPDPRLAFDLFMGTLNAVAHAHEQGLIHRDLKPGNILLQHSAGEWIPKVTDFGLAKMMEGDSNLSKTRSGVAMGTPSYMSPEQIRDAKTVDERGDVFALGCILYELFTGRQTFYGEDVLEIFNKIAGGEFVKPRDLVEDLPAEVEAAILGALQCDKNRRVPDCLTLRAILRKDATASAWMRRSNSQDTFLGEAPTANPTLLPSHAEALPSGETRAPAEVFERVSLGGPEAAGGQAGETVLRTPQHPTQIRPGAGIDTIAAPASSQPTLHQAEDANAPLGGPLTALGISQTTLEPYPPTLSAGGSPVILAVAVGLLVILAIGVGVGVGAVMMKNDPLVVNAPVPIEMPAPVEVAEPIVPVEKPRPRPVPAPEPVVAPVQPVPTPAPVAVVEPTPTPAPVDVEPAAAMSAGSLEPVWQGILGGNFAFVVQIDSQRGQTFRATATHRGRSFRVRGTFDDTSVSFQEEGGRRFAGSVQKNGKWNGTVVNADGSEGAQWFLQPLP